MISISANPNSKITLAIQSTDGYGELSDGYATPAVDFIILPDGTPSSGFPIFMTQISTGIWKYSFLIDKGADALGSYIASCSWYHPTTGYKQNELFFINVSAPYGNSTIYPG